MQFKLPCYPCFLRQVIDAKEKLGISEEKSYSLMQDALDILKNADTSLPAPVIARGIYDRIIFYSGKEDPYKEYKEQYTKLMLEKFSEFESFINQDPLNAFKLASVANTIDFGTGHKIVVDDLIEQANSIKKIFYLNDLSKFKGKEILYLADNAGEHVLDLFVLKVLKDELGVKHIYYVVRSKPIINDVTIDDLHSEEFFKLATVLKGTKYAGFYVPAASKELQELFYKIDLVISKGQGNWETLSEEKRDIIFMLKVKCKPVSEYIKLPVGTYVL